MSTVKLNVQLKGESADKFKRIKAYLELENDTEVVRTLVRVYHKDHEDELIGPPKTMWHMNVNEYGVLIWDPSLGGAIQVHFKPEGITCDQCDLHDCKHIIFALSKEDVQEIVRRKRLEGWKLPEV